MSGSIDHCKNKRKTLIHKPIGFIWIKVSLALVIGTANLWSTILEEDHILRMMNCKLDCCLLR